MNGIYGSSEVLLLGQRVTPCLRTHGRTQMSLLPPNLGPFCTNTITPLLLKTIPPYSPTIPLKLPELLVCSQILFPGFSSVPEDCFRIGLNNCLKPEGRTLYPSQLLLSPSLTSINKGRNPPGLKSVCFLKSLSVNVRLLSFFLPDFTLPTGREIPVRGHQHVC